MRHVVESDGEKNHANFQQRRELVEKPASEMLGYGRRCDGLGKEHDTCEVPPSCCRTFFAPFIGHGVR